MQKIIIVLCTLGLTTLLLTSCKSTTNTPQHKEEKPLPDGTIASEIIVQLKEKSDKALLIREFSAYGLKELRTIAPNPPMYLLGYNTELITPWKMLTLLEADPRVKQAEFNKRTSPRAED